MAPKFIQLGHQRIAYYESRGTGPAVVMIHGNSMSGLSFLKQLESPLGERYRLIAIDLPGHGMSDKAPEPEKGYTLPGYAEMLVSFVNQLRLQKAVFVGWCFGGYILMEAANSLPAAGLIIYGAAPIASQSSIHDAFLPNPAFPLAFKADWTEEDIKLFFSIAIGSDEKDLPPFFREDILRSDGRTRQVLGESVGAGNFRDEVNAVANLTHPIAFILGEKDGYVRKSYLEGLHIPTLWRGKIQIIPDAGHTPQWEQPEAFNSLLEEFIEDVTG